MPPRSVLLAHHEAGNVLEKDQRHAALIAQLDEVRDLQRRFREQHAVIGDDADEKPVQPGESGHNRRRVALLELVETRAIHEPGDHLADVVRPPPVCVDDAVQLLGVERRVFRGRDVGGQRLPPVECFHEGACHVEGMRIVLGKIVGHARKTCVHVGAAKVLGCNLFTGRGLHEGRTAEKDCPGTLDDDGLVRHRRHVGATRGARTHHDGNLGDPFRRHPRLVEENASEMFLVGKHVRLERQERATRVDQVDTGKPVFQRDLLGAQVFLHRDRVVGPAFDGCVVGDDDDLPPRYASDAGHEAGPGGAVLVHVPRSQRREFEEGRPGIEQRVDPLAHRQLSLFAMPLDVPGAAPLAAHGQPIAELFHQAGEILAIRVKFRGVASNLALDAVHGFEQTGSNGVGIIGQRMKPSSSDSKTYML